MKAWEYNAVVYDADVFCVACLPDDISSEHVTPIFSVEEWDYRPSCCVCGEVHDYMRLSLDAAMKELNADAIEWE